MGSAVVMVRGLVLLAWLVRSSAGQHTPVVGVPFAQAAIWAAELPELRVCDGGINDAGGCPGRPEHGGSGFLSAVFTWRYVMNNLRAALIGASGPGYAQPPEGAGDAVRQVLAALDQLMEQPLLDVFGEVVRAARSLFEGMKPYLTTLTSVPVQLPLSLASGSRYWRWPSDGRTTLGQAAFTLRTGAQMPAIGFGTWRLWAKEAYQPVRWALEAGYRHIDTAEGYANEAEIGKALKDSGVPRQDVFIATKASSVPKGLAPMEHAEAIFSMQLEQLGTDYVDLYMLHTPPQDVNELRSIWTVLETLFRQGRARALGISNCDVNDLRNVMSFATVPPVYIQNLFKIYKPGEQLPQKEDIVSLAQANQIVVMGYSVQTDWPHILPPLQDPHVLNIAQQLGRTPSQVLHRWALQRGIGVIPKSATKERILENARLFDFELPDAAMRLLDGLATLSESGVDVKPAHQEDVFRLSELVSPPKAPQASFAMPASTYTPPQHQPAQSSSVPLERSRNQGFRYAEIQPHLLAQPIDLPPNLCQQQCLGEPRCAAWEVCAPVDAQAGCGGCYLIGQPPATTLHIDGWYAAVERHAS